MILGNLKKRPYLVFMLSCLIMQSCNSDYDEFVADTSVSNNETVTQYEAVLQSNEFKEYDSKYTNLMSIIDDVASRMTEEEKNELSKLGELYVSDPERYSTLFRYEVTKVLGNDSIRAKGALSLVLEAKNNLMKNEKLKKEIEGNEVLISAELKVNRDINSRFISGYTPILKTRVENNLDKLTECNSLCKESYDNRTDVADAALLCGTAVNIAMCLGSLGVSAPGGVVTQLGLTIIYRNEKEAALKDYDICTRNCELSYKK